MYNKRDRKIYNIIEASLKDANILSNNHFYLGTNRGIIDVTINSNLTFKINHLKI